MAIPVSHKANLDTIYRAVSNKALAIVECQEKATGKVVNVLCAIGWDGSEHTIVPFATMFDSNPYDVLNPPNPDGGFHSE